MSTINDIWDIIKDIDSRENITKQELDLLEELSENKDSDIRYIVAESLYDRDEKKAEKILLKLLVDKNSMVRVSACDSLRSSKSKEIMEILKKHTTDSAGLVRGYAVSSIADIGVNIGLIGDSDLISFLQEAFSKEKNSWVIINYNRALYQISQQEEYFQNLLKDLNNPKYRNRCLVINFLVDIANKNNISDIIIAFENRLKVEDPEIIAVTSSLKTALEDLKQKELI